MNWQKISIQRLRDYENRKRALELIPEQLETLELHFTSIRSATTDGTPVTGGDTNRREDALITNIVMRDELKNNQTIAEREINITDKGLAALTEEQRRILNVFFVNRPYRHIEILCEELHIEKTKLYMEKDEALKRFTMACYGVVEV